MKFTIVLLVAISAIAAAKSLKSDNRMQCYYCSGPMSGSCAQAEPREMVKVACGPRNFNDDDYNSNGATYYYNCVKFVRKLPGNAEATVRGCSVLPTPGDPCEYLKKKIRAIDCEYCNSTLCNTNADDGSILAPDYIYSVHRMVE